MGKKKQISEKDRHAIVALCQHSGMTQKQIAHKYRTSQCAVSVIMKQFKNTGTVTVKRRSGRPKATSEKEDRLILRQVKKNPFISASQIKASMSPHLAGVSTRTITRRLRNKFKMPARTPRKKPLITEKARKRRLSWCLAHREWTVHQWKRVTFSDESTFLQFQQQRQYVRRPPGVSPTDNRFTVKTVKHAPSIMVWGCFSHHGRGALYFLPKGQKMNTEVYLQVLEEKLPTFMDISGTDIFQQDNAPCHRSRRSRKWFEDHQIEVLDWPANSPDLNPIENLWRRMKVVINQGTHDNVNALKEAITKAWCTAIDKEECVKLIESMPRRIEAVIRNRGFPTKY